MSLTTIGYAILGGFLPSFIWLYFLLGEDAKHPEPKTMIALAFVAGMIAVPVSIPLEQLVLTFTHKALPVLASWSFIEELLKYLMAAVFILWRPVVDEAPDYVIYMVTVALGFAAAENTLYLITPVASGHIASTFYVGDTRFLGSTLLHVFASAAVGFALAFSEELSSLKRVVAVTLGLILAIALHTAFDTLMISGGASSQLSAISLIWMAAVVFFAIFEVLKYFQYRKVLI